MNREKKEEPQIGKIEFFYDPRFRLDELSALDINSKGPPGGPERSPIVIRIAEEKDLEKLVQAYQKTEKHISRKFSFKLKEGKNIADALKYYFRESLGPILLAEDKDKNIFGFGVVDIVEHQNKHRIKEIGIFVDPEYKNSDLLYERLFLEIKAMYRRYFKYVPVRNFD